MNNLLRAARFLVIGLGLIALQGAMTREVCAQIRVGTIEGTVRDANGAVIRDVVVIATSPALEGGEQKAVTNADGTFSIGALPPGMYTVRVLAAGFSSWEHSGVEVRVGGTRTLSIQLAAPNKFEELRVDGDSGVTYTIYGGVSFSSFTGDVNSMAQGPSLPSPNGSGRTFSAFGTHLAEPGSGILASVISSLGRTPQIISLDDYLATTPPAKYAALIGVRGSVALQEEGRFSPYYSAEFYKPFEESLLDQGQLIESAESVRGALGDLFRDATSPVVTFTTTSEGGYFGNLSFGGGIEVDAGRISGNFDLIVRAGAGYDFALGSPEVNNTLLNMRFTAGLSDFDQTDVVTLQSVLDHRVFVEFGATGEIRGSLKPFARGRSPRVVSSQKIPAKRGGLVIDAGVRIYRRHAQVTITTNPTTTSSAPGTIAFATPPGSQTIVITTVPGGVSSLSESVDRHPIWTAKGWGVAPTLRVGWRF